MEIPFNKPSVEGKEVEYILQAIQSGKIGGDGDFNRLCGDEIAETIGVKKVFLTASCTDAMELAALLYGIQSGDEIIMPSFTYVSTATAFCLRGAKPVFVDIRSDTLNMDEKQIESLITERTKAIVPVHYAGVACEMKRINQIANQHSLRVIEDAAHGFLASYKGKYLGAIGDIGCYSFHETKTFTAGEGGAIVLNNEDDIPAVEILIEKGTNRTAFFRGEVDRYSWVELGSSFLPSALIGAFLYGQFQARDTIIAKRKAIHENYDRLLQPLTDRGLIQPMRIPDGCLVNHHLYYFLVDEPQTRADLLTHLRKEGVQAVFHFTPLHQSPYAKRIGVQNRLPVTESVADRIVRLPFYNRLTLEEQETIVEKIFDFLGV